ncbi:Protein wings apart-like [Bienertia sinuspersici]
MMVRTYGRRKIGRSLSDTSIDFEEEEEDDDDPFTFRESTTTNSTSTSYSQYHESPQEIGKFTFSSQDSTRFVNSQSEDSNNNLSLQLLAPAERRREKVRRLNDEGREKEKEKEVVTPTATLMETQEYGEMMECVDEVEFALDGLRGRKGVRVRRARSGQLPFGYIVIHSVSAKIVENQLLLNLFLKRQPSISQKLLMLRKDMLLSQDMATRVDSSSNTIMQKFWETLVSCKDLTASNAEDDDISRTELNPNWISLLTMEKACLSTFSIEDTFGTVKKTGGNFKEKLRQLGGLNAVFELAINFHSTLEGSTEHVAPSVIKSKDGKLQCLPLLLKCLKIMENATFLSKENQSHFLGLKGNLAAGQGSSLSFVKLMIVLSRFFQLLLGRTFSANSSPENPTNHPNGLDWYLEFRNTERKVDTIGVSSLSSSQECSSSGRYSSNIGVSTSQSSQRLSSSQSGSVPSNSGATTRFGVGNCLIEKAATSFGSGSCSLTSKASNVGAPANGHSSKSKLAQAKSPFDDDDDMLI